MTHANLPATLSVGDTLIHQKDGLYSLNDLHQASGGDAKNRPSLFLANEQTKSLITEITKAGIPALVSQRGGNSRSGTYACRELVIAYASWISAAFHLKIIRVFLDAAAPAQADKLSANRPAPVLPVPAWPRGRPKVIPIAPDMAERIDDATYLISGLQHLIARTIMKDLMTEIATGSGVWRNRRWLLHLTGDDLGALNLPNLTPIPPNHPLAQMPL